MARRRRFSRYPKRRRRRSSSKMTKRDRKWGIYGALGITALFIAMPHIFSNILARVRGGV